MRFSKSLALGIFAAVASAQSAASAQTVCTQCLRVHTSFKPTYQSTTTKPSTSTATTTTATAKTATATTTTGTRKLSTVSHQSTVSSQPKVSNQPTVVYQTTTSYQPVTSSRPATSSYQAQAQYEAQQMASRRYKGHIRGTIPGVSFCGVGWSSSSPNAPTCRPSRSMTLVADATVRGTDGWYRVRYWR